MPTYEVACCICGEQELYAPIKEAAQFMPCPVCERPRPQIIHPPVFQEDRLRLWKGPLGNRYSTALGQTMPESRAERDRVAKQRGVEFCSKADFLASNPEAAQAVAYTEHVNTGGAREDPRPVPTNGFKAKPDWAKDLVG